MERATQRTRPGTGRDLLVPDILAPVDLAAWRLDLGGLGHAFALLEWPLPIPGTSSPWHSLTPAEMTIAALASAGRSNAGIARERGCSVRTVANQVARIFRKLGVHSRAELAALAFRRSVRSA